MTTLNNPRYSDVSLTFRSNPVTGDVVTLLNEDAVKASVINLVMTMHFETPFHPEIGCSVMRSLFDNLGTMTAVNIKRSITDVLQNFEPRVQVLAVNVSVDSDANGYDAQIIYQVVGNTTPVTVTMFLAKTR